MNLAQSLEALIASLKCERPNLVMPGGASEEQLDELDAFLGFPLPEQFKSLYRLHDGEFALGSREFVGLFCDYEFLSLGHVKKVCSLIRETHAFWHNGDVHDETEYTSNPTNCVRLSMLELKWIPFAGYFGGNHLGLDLNPGPGGTMGQVINFGADDTVHFQVALDLAGFVDLVRSQYAKRRWHSAFEGDQWSLYDTLKREHAG